MSEKIKKCPCCGGGGTLVWKEGDDAFGGVWFVRCQTCGLEGPGVYQWGIDAGDAKATQQGAIREWNKRGKRGIDPCPFCGCPVVECIQEGKRFYLRCEDCFSTSVKGSKATVVKLWNKRTV